MQSFRKRKYDDVYQVHEQRIAEQYMVEQQEHITEQINQNILNKFDNMFNQVMRSVRNLERRITEIESIIGNTELAKQKNINTKNEEYYESYIA